MKMKKACEATNLTERAIRLYIAKGLITPNQKDGLIDFTPEDIQHLRDIALLRQMDFTMEQIGGMIANAEDIPAILAARREAAQAGSAHEGAVFAALSNLNDVSLTDLHALADSIRARSMSPTLNFSQFDEITEEERCRASAAASKEVERQQKRQQHLRHLIIAGGILLVVMIGTFIFLTRTCIKGYIAVSPVTVVDVTGNRATFRIGNEEAAELLGCNIITVRYVADGFATGFTPGPRIAPGDVAEEASQLAIELTNWDLLRLGIDPLQDFDGGSSGQHNQWMTLILQAEFADGESNNAALWLRYLPETTPLLWGE